MTGFGSAPCGSCKFLRKKCARGCVFAPYFCDEKGATRFEAIHKVFGASNVSKLLIQLPLADRSQAAATISYQAQARFQDPIYGCVSHIFALQQQVVNLQAQLVSLKAQAAAAAPPLPSFTSGSSSTCSPQEEVINYNNFPPPYRQDWHASLFRSQSSVFDPTMSGETATYYGSDFQEARKIQPSLQCYANVISEENIFGGSDSSSSCEMMRQLPFNDTEDLQSIAFAYIQHT